MKTTRWRSASGDAEVTLPRVRAVIAELSYEVPRKAERRILVQWMKERQA
jgi:hypothetical protein